MKNMIKTSKQLASFDRMAGAKALMTPFQEIANKHKNQSFPVKKDFFASHIHSYVING